MNEFIVRDNKGHKHILKVYNNEVYIIKRHLRSWVKYTIGIIISIITIVIGILIAHNIIK